jgi:hypothetical protein
MPFTHHSALRRPRLEFVGTPMSVPRTCSEASRLIDELKRRAVEPRSDRRREIRAVQDDLARDRGDAVRVREFEISGYGSSATWKGGRS